jgi:hypothetical protein
MDVNDLSKEIYKLLKRDEGSLQKVKGSAMLMDW